MKISDQMRLIADLLREQIDRDVRSRLRNERVPFVQVAKDWAAFYRDMRKKDPELPVLLVDDFRDYLRFEYLVGCDAFDKLAPKKNRRGT